MSTRGRHRRQHPVLQLLSDHASCDGKSLGGISSNVLSRRLDVSLALAVMWLLGYITSSVCPAPAPQHGHAWVVPGGCRLIRSWPRRRWRRHTQPPFFASLTTPCWLMCCRLADLCLSGFVKGLVVRLPTLHTCGHQLCPVGHCWAIQAGAPKCTFVIGLPGEALCSFRCGQNRHVCVQLSWFPDESALVSLTRPTIGEGP